MRKHSNICPDCGAYLDPGERCDCEEGKAHDHEGKITDHAGSNQAKSSAGF